MGFLVNKRKVTEDDLVAGARLCETPELKAVFICNNQRAHRAATTEELYFGGARRTITPWRAK
jgi:hypothetical protein